MSEQSDALRLAKIVTEQKTSHGHPLKLWSELNDINWLRHDRGPDEDATAAEASSDGESAHTAPQDNHALRLDTTV